MKQEKLTKKDIELENEVANSILNILNEAGWEDRRKFEGSLSVLANLIINIINCAESQERITQSATEEILEFLFHSIDMRMQEIRKFDQ